MFKSRPLFLIVITLCLLVVVLASYWLALLPHRTLRNMQTEILETSGHRLEARTAKLDLSKGFAIVLEDVSIANPDLPSWSLNARSIEVPGFLGGAYIVDKPLIEVDVAAVSAAQLRLPPSIVLREGTLKLRDPARKAVLAMTDVNGEVFAGAANALQGRMTLVWDSQVSDLDFTIEDMARFVASGSPMDFTLKGKNRIFSFSGQGRLQNGFKLAGQTTIASQDVSSLFKWLGAPLQMLNDAGAVSLQSGFASEGLSASFEKIEGKVGTTDITGKLNVEAGVDRPRLSGEVAMSHIVAWGPKLTNSILQRPWSEKPLPVSDVAVLDFDLAFSAEKVTLRGHDVGPISARIRTEDNQTMLSVLEQPFGGGSGTMNWIFAKAGNDLRVESSVALKSVQAMKIFGALLGFESFDGEIDLKATVKAQGQSVAALVSSLQGQMNVTAPAITVLTTDFTTLLAKPTKGWNTQAGAKTVAVNLDLGARLEEGVAKLDASAIRFGGITLKPRGEIDILRQALTLQLFPRGSSADPKMSVSGPWVEPQFSTAPVLKEKTVVTPPAN